MSFLSKRHNLRLIPQKEVIRDAQLRNKVSEMIAEAETKKDLFPLLKEWYKEPEPRNLYVIFDADRDGMVGLVGWAGPTDVVEPFWWIRPESRKKGHGKHAVEILVGEMARKRVREIGNIIIDAKTEGEQTASEKLANHLKKCFRKLRNLRAS